MCASKISLPSVLYYLEIRGNLFIFCPEYLTHKRTRENTPKYLCLCKKYLGKPNVFPLININSHNDLNPVSFRSPATFIGSQVYYGRSGFDSVLQYSLLYCKIV